MNLDFVKETTDRLRIIDRIFKGDERDMKVHISVDMEGIAGVAQWPQVTPGDPAYPFAREWMTSETNAAIEGACAAGATEIVVNDSHDGMYNLLYDRIHPAARLITGSAKPLQMMEGIDASFDAAMFIGYHTRGGAFGTLAHTWSSIVTDCRVNGRPIGEWGLNALIAGHYGVPVVLVTGDDRVAAEVGEAIPGIETVVVKRAISRYAAESLPHAEVLRLISAGAERALKRRAEIAPYTLAQPIKLELTFATPNQADGAAFLPRATRTSALSVTTSAADGIEVVRAFISMLALARYYDP